MTLFYPNNFPKQLEEALLGFLLSLQNENRQLTISYLKKKMYAFFSDKQKTVLLKGKTPPFWWLQFVLLRHKKKFSPSYVAILQSLLTKTKIRSLSGIVPLTVFTKGVGCPFNCIYCPNEPGVPKSYLSDEPAIMRAIRNKYNPFKQVQSRLLMFLLSGHPIDKVELIIKGGTFSFFSQPYRTLFVQRLFDAANTNTKQLIEKGNVTKYTSSSLIHSQKKNEKGCSRIIGINVETRPDFINNRELRFLRKLGVTHVEIGVQNPNDNIYSIIKRGHTVKNVTSSTQQLKDAGFKVGYHLMPNLPGSSPEIDTTILREIFINNFFKPDHLKLYPTTIAKHTHLLDLYQQEKYVPYPTKILVDILAEWKANHVPPWVRIGRLTRDITTQMMDVHLFPPNFRELLHSHMKLNNKKCSCIRCREIQNTQPVGKTSIRIIEYTASKGKEFFIEAVDQQMHCLGFVRLRLPSYLYHSKSKPLFSSLSNHAIIRELHIYGQQEQIGNRSQNSIQHKGLGSILLEKAEEIAKKHNLNIAIISGVGVRDYYRKRGYSLKDTYMIK